MAGAARLPDVEPQQGAAHTRCDDARRPRAAGGAARRRRRGDLRLLARARWQALGLMDAAERHPRLVRVWTPPYGTTGPWSEMRRPPRRADGADRRGVPPVELRVPAGLPRRAGAALRAGHHGRRRGRRGAVGARQERARPGGDGERALNAVALVGGASGNILPTGRRPLGASPSYRLYECGDGQFLFLATLFSYFFQRAVRGDGPGGGAGRGRLPRGRHRADGGALPREAARRVAGDPARRRRAGRRRSARARTGCAAS